MDYPSWPAAQLPVHDERRISAEQQQPIAAHHTITTAHRPDHIRLSALVRSRSTQFIAHLGCGPPERGHFLPFWRDFHVTDLISGRCLCLCVPIHLCRMSLHLRRCLGLHHLLSVCVYDSLCRGNLFIFLYFSLCITYFLIVRACISPCSWGFWWKYRWDSALYPPLPRCMLSRVLGFSIGGIPECLLHFLHVF